MKNLIDFCHAVASLCDKCDGLFYSYEIIRDLDVSDFPADLRLRVFAGDNMISDVIFRAIPSDMHYSVSLRKDGNLCLVIW